MNGTEERLRSALHHSADEVEVDEFGSLDRIRAGGATARRHRAILRTSAGTVGVAAAVLIGVVVLRDDGRTNVEIPPVDQPTTTATGPITTGTVPTTAPTTAPAIEVPVAVFPASPRFTDPTEATAAFISEFLGFPGEAYVIGDPSLGDGGGSVEVFGRNEDGSVGRVRSTIVLRAGAGGYWYVDSAISSSIEVDSPTPRDFVSSPLAVSGRGEGYEGHIGLSVIDRSGSVIGETFTTAGGSGTLEPFAVDLDYTAPSNLIGALLVHNSTGLEVGPVDFSVVRLAFGGSPAVNAVPVYFHDRDGNLIQVLRPSEPFAGLRTAIINLIQGPTPSEQAQGIHSPFSEASGSDVSATITGGAAVVDFLLVFSDGEFDVAVASAADAGETELLLAELNATVFQFPAATSVEYQLTGSCEEFWALLDVESCTVIPRS